MLINNYTGNIKPEFFDIILSNPPYFKLTDLSKKNDEPRKAVARHEIKLNLDLSLLNATLPNDTAEDVYLGG